MRLESRLGYWGGLSLPSSAGRFWLLAPSPCSDVASGVGVLGDCASTAPESDTEASVQNSNSDAVTPAASVRMNLDGLLVMKRKSGYSHLLCHEALLLRFTDQLGECRDEFEHYHNLTTNKDYVLITMTRL